MERDRVSVALFMKAHKKIQKMTWLVVVVTITTLLPMSVKAQYVELGLSAGTMAYNGDLIHTYMRHNDYRPAYGGFIAVPLSNHFSLRASLMRGYISGADSLAARPSSRDRNLSFYTDITEGSLLVDFYLWQFHPNKFSRRISPYVSAGLTVFHFNPKSMYNGVEYELQPLRTEGQGTSAFPDRQPYALTQVAIPLEIGIKFHTSQRTTLALTGGFRYTFTDYLDDASRTYVDADVIINEVGEVAYALSNRTWATNGGEPTERGNNSMRAGADSKDYYGWIGMNFSIYLSREYRYVANRKSGISCPKF